MATNRQTLLDPVRGIPILLCLTWILTGWLGRPIGDYGVETDFYGDLVVFARQWMAGEPSIMTGFRGPFYYLLIGVSEKVFGDAFAVAKVLSSVSAALSLLFVGLLLNRLWGRVVALAGVLFVAANPVFSTYAFRACTDTVYLALFTGTLYFLLGSDDRRRTWMLAGLCAGLAVLTRYNGFALIPCALLVALVTVRPLPRAIGRLVAFASVWVVVTAPWFAFVWKETGDPFWSNAFQNIAIDVYVSHPGLAHNGQFVQQVGFVSIDEVIRVHPAGFVAAMARNSVEHAWRDIRELVGVVWVVAALLGAVMGLAWWRRQRAVAANTDEREADATLFRKRFAYILVGVLIYASFIPVFYNTRFMTSLLPFWALGIGLLVQGMGRIARASTLVSGVAVAVLLLLTAYSQYRVISRTLDPTSDQSCPAELLEIAEAARQSGYRFGADTPVAARKPHIGYYLGTPVVSIPSGAFDQVGRGGAVYLLVTGKEAKSLSTLRPLMAAEYIPEGYKVVAQGATPVSRTSSRVGTLYKLPSSAPYERPKTGPRERVATPGLDRIDTLRLKVARWYHVWDCVQPSATLLQKIEDRNHPDVLTAWGDLAFLEGDLPEARKRYLRTLPDPTSQAGREPPGTDNFLRLAAVSFLQSDLPAFREAVQQYMRLKGMEPPISILSLRDSYGSLVESKDPIGALGLLTACVDLEPNSVPLVREFGKLLMLTGWHEQGRPVLERYLRVRPNDQVISDMLDNPPKRRR